MRYRRIENQALTAPAQRGNEGKWQTPNQRDNVAQRLEMGASIEAGDAGIWVTCQRGLERKAITEMTRMCEEVSRLLLCGFLHKSLR